MAERPLFLGRGRRSVLRGGSSRGNVLHRSKPRPEITVSSPTAGHVPRCVRLQAQANEHTADFPVQGSLHGGILHHIQSSCLLRDGPIFARSFRGALVASAGSVKLPGGTCGEAEQPFASPLPVLPKPADQETASE